VLQNVYISLPYIVAVRTARIDRNDEIATLLTYIQYTAAHGVKFGYRAETGEVFEIWHKRAVA